MLATIGGCPSPTFVAAGPRTLTAHEAAPEVGRGSTLVVLTDGQDGSGSVEARCGEFIAEVDRWRWRFRDAAGSVVAEIRAHGSPGEALCAPGTPVAIRRELRSGAVAWSVVERDDTTVFGARERLLAAGGRDLPLPHEPAPGWRLEVANTPEHLVASEVAVTADGCTTAWNHLRLGLFRGDEAIWAGPGEVRTVAGYRFEVHASAWPLESDESRCERPPHVAWSLMFTLPADAGAATP